MVWGLFGPSSIRPPFVAWVQISLKLYTISYFHVWNDIPMKSVKVIFRWRMGNRCVHRAQTALLHNAKKKKSFPNLLPFKKSTILKFLLLTQDRPVSSKYNPFGSARNVGTVFFIFFLTFFCAVWIFFNSFFFYNSLKY